MILVAPMVMTVLTQVRAEIEKMKRRTEEAQLFNTELVQAADQGKISSAVSQQVALLGSRRLYERINTNLKISKFEPHFAKVNFPSWGGPVSWDPFRLQEQFELYNWREEYFHTQFPEDSWFTDGADDSHDFDTVPYQVMVILYYCQFH